MTQLHKGLKNRSASATDKSTHPKGGAIGKNPVRTSVAKSPGTLGPRTA